MRSWQLNQNHLEERRRLVLAVGFTLIMLVAAADWVIEPNLGLGFLYFLPILLMSGLLARWQVAALALGCAVLREALGPFPHGWISVPRTLLVWTGFAGVGLFVREVGQNQKLVMQHLNEMSREVRRRTEAEEQLRILVETSPAAIVVADQEGRIVLSNQAAGAMFGSGQGSLGDKQLSRFLPSIAGLQASDRAGDFFRSALECRAYRENGELFLVQVLFSTFDLESGRHLAAIVFDISEQLREREEIGLNRLRIVSEVTAAAVSHEIRNMCGAASVIQSNLERVGALAGNEDFEALRVVIDGLRRLASAELMQRAKSVKSTVDLQKCLDDLRIVIEPSFRESHIDLCWSLSAKLPKVYGDRDSLLQVFLNLAQNSQRAMLDVPQRQLTIATQVSERKVTVEVSDTGHGVSAPERLFRPFQPGAESSGLGLYVSQAMVRAFSGDLRYEAQPGGARFVVELERADH